LSKFLDTNCRKLNFDSSFFFMSFSFFVIDTLTEPYANVN
jgi:hypothetical protein